MDKLAAARVLTLDLHRLDLRYSSLPLPDPPAIAADVQLVPCIAVTKEGEAFILVDGYRHIAALRHLGRIARGRTPGAGVDLGGGPRTASAP